MADHSLMKLGKNPPRRDARTLMLARYTLGLPKAPEQCDWGNKLSTIGVMRNDTLGDCTCAAIGHMIQVWTSQASSEVTISDDDVVLLYEQACGYVPGDSYSDHGGIELDVLKFWRGNPVSGHSIEAFCDVQPGSHDDVRDAVWLFGTAYIGLALPISARSQDVWTVPSTGTERGDGFPGTWGGHAVAVCAYDARGLTCLTWGARKTMSWEFWAAYCDEAHVALSRDWLNGPYAPNGFDFDALKADMAGF